MSELKNCANLYGGAKTRHIKLTPQQYQALVGMMLEAKGLSLPSRRG